MKPSACPVSPAALDLAIIGAGPAGLALALHAAQRLPRARITVYDRWPARHDLSGDRRTLALAQGSVQFLDRLGVGAAIAGRAAPILEVHVSQQQPGLLELLGLPAAAQLSLKAADLGVPQLGAVVAYGAIVEPMRAAWRARCEAEPQRLQARLGCAVQAVDTLDEAAGEGRGVAVRWLEAAVARPEGPAEVLETARARHDLAVIAEGGVFAEQSRKAVARDYRQVAWVGTVELEGGRPGVAYERFTPQGPVALLPLPAAAGGRAQAALVWCVPADDDPVRGLDTAQRLAVLQHVLPASVGRLVGLGPLKDFALGLNAERTLVQGRAVRIGNAAQTLHPVAGQGLNLGLRDVHALVEQLERRPDLEQALSGMEWQRGPDRWSLIAGTDFLARSFTWDAPGLSTLRGVGLGLLQRLPGLSTLLARQMMFGRR
ncbi:2-octaprenyl-6-methoxyphenol hydroxylase [Sphaerotilus hippei]|uniref:2-octaprenyl-6-methoxyphenol hydroxylase n=1 Tax=Sphaerotilus hippei TaxID=744406 RepID=A0A318H5X0_9BURK|nr:FAD-dependent monooxygenase [Sphaerotilus hippei]PXW94584.1 2-octaprenyl-6-methoxyphenol hydroxylase [Sphaerotilus hippei]